MAGGGGAAETMSVSRDIVATWRRPRTVMRSLLAQGRREDRALMFLILACGIIFVSQWPVISREAALDAAGAPLQARLAITFFAWLMIWPLAFYGIGSLTHLVLRALGGRGSYYTARLALFWTLLASAPAWLFYGLVRRLHWAGACPNACRDRPGLGLRHDLGHLFARSRVQPGGGGRRMTDILTLGTLLRLARDTVSNPREGAATILSYAPARQALWLMFALVIVLSLLIRELVGLVTDLPTGGPIMGPMQDSSLILGLVMAGFLYLTIHAVHRIGRFFGGTGSFEEAALLVVWLQFILICIQVIQIVTLFVLPPLAGLITIIAIALYIWLLVNFIAVLHGFTSLGMVFVATLMSAFALLFAFSIVLSVLGLAVPAP
jgi:hypothetical protein